MKKIQKIIVIFAVMFSFAYAGAASNSEKETVDAYRPLPIIENTGFIYETPVFLKVDCYDVFTVCDNHAPDDHEHFMDCMESNGC